MGRQGKGKRKNKALSPYPYKFRGLVLDEFQAQAIMRLRQGTSTLVAAPTGTGKTLIADYLVDMCLNEERRIIYTGPIKALVSQKYRNFKQNFGRDRVGIMTGDLSINPNAPVVVMTTEIFRNMLLQNAVGLSDVAWVIFDEIHYLDHEVRGAVWEEAIMLMPPGMRLLGLSATIPNAQQIGAWIQSVHQDPTAVIEHHERAVPLVHLYFNQVCQAVPREFLLRSYVGTVMPGQDDLDTKAGALEFAEVWNSPRVRGYRETTSHLDVISYVAGQRLFPCLYFVFSRRLCQQKAAELTRRSSFLTANEREVVRIAVKRTLEELHLNRSQIPGIDAMEEQWRQGIAVHHAGLLPAVKRIVEVLLERKVLRVVYATETFAVGVNMPVRSVCFDTLQKYDGSGYRPLSFQEYFQMAGRAGRRGADRQGTVISLVDFTHLARTTLPDWEDSKLEAIHSRLSISFNMAANLCARYTDAETFALYYRSLAAFQEQQRGADYGSDVAAERLYTEYLEKKRILTALGYIQGDQLTAKGVALCTLYVKELLVAELLYSEMLPQLSVPQIAGLAAAIVYERGVTEGFSLSAQPWIAELDMLKDRLQRQAGVDLGTEVQVFPPVAKLITMWAEGTELTTVLKDSPLQAGDMVSLCRQVIDLLRQMIRVVSDNPHLQETLQRTIDAVDRDVVQVHI
jgi:superfamily II RNA helicase